MQVRLETIIINHGACKRDYLLKLTSSMQEWLKIPTELERACKRDCPLKLAWGV